MAAKHFYSIGTGASVGVVGAGAMGAGIAQVAAMAGHRVLIFDTRQNAPEAAIRSASDGVEKLRSKGRLSEDQARHASSSMHPADSLEQLGECALVIEAIVEDLAAKRALFYDLEQVVAREAILATNTSSLSVTAIAAGLQAPERVAGMHFFNPAPLMELVELVSGLATAAEVISALRSTTVAWGKTPVLARSTPGFIVNRVARSFYGESLRLLEEGAADPATLDAVMRDCGGFRMGPFELMDLIGHDVNYAVTRSVFEGFSGDPRFTPSLRQKDLVDAGYLGRKTGHGFFCYGAPSSRPLPATYPPHPAPQSVRLFGDHPLASALRDRLPTADVQTRPEGENDSGLIADARTFALYVTDGRTATQRAADSRSPNIVLVDLALDYASAKRLCITAADQADPTAMAHVAGLLQAAGFAVSTIEDAPGMVVMRTVATLANEAADAVHQGVCSAADCDLAMRLGVNYPRGPLAWADEVGAARLVQVLDHLAAVYGQSRYRVSPLMRRRALTGTHLQPTIQERPS